MSLRLSHTTETRSIGWGVSLPVPNIQELVAKGSLATISPRYIRTDQDPPLAPPDFDLPEIPIIDMNNLLLDGEEGGDQAFRAELEKLDSLAGNGVSSRDALEAYSAEIVKLTTAITCNFAKALNMVDGDMAGVFYEGLLAYRMNYYPPCQQPELAIGITPHSDASALTMLLQANDTEGLQIKKDGRWVPVKPHPNALVINIGDVMEIVSNGAYRSIEHQVVVNSANERISIASFFGANVNGEIGPASSLISPNNPPMFKRIATLDYLKGRFSKTNMGKSYLDAMRITKD